MIRGSGAGRDCRSVNRIYWRSNSCGDAAHRSDSRFRSGQLLACVRAFALPLQALLLISRQRHSHARSLFEQSERIETLLVLTANFTCLLCNALNEHTHVIQIAGGFRRQLFIRDVDAKGTITIEMFARPADGLAREREIGAS